LRAIGLLISIALLIPGDGGAQVPYRSPDDLKPRDGRLMLGYRPEAYFSEMYALYSRTGLLFFEGEPIAIRLAVGNIGPAVTSLIVKTTNPLQLFQVAAFKAPLTNEIPDNRGWSSGPRGRYRDELPVHVPIQFSNPQKAWPGGTFDLRMEAETVLDPHDAVEWVVTVPSNLEPGLYRFVVDMNATDREGRPIPSFTSFGVEIRPRTPDAQPEILRRAALRSFFNEDYAGARRTAADLLRIHPNASAAYHVLAMVAEKEGKKAEATAHENTAAAIVRTGRDHLLLKNRGGRIE
jgi:hypothetical protein